MHWERATTRPSVLLACVVTGCAAWAANTNVPATIAKNSAKPQDYRLLLERVRIKQQEKKRVDDVQKAIQAFQMRHGHLPAELKDLVERGVLSELPTPPRGTRFFYDRIVGNVRLVPATRPPTCRVRPI
ncbi:MAG: hypothetical protein EPN23_03860 [Verrucomicrobia bacterium]|nr:MAG: hypothetical protein EPN23_03860 [Verrucomicrobiota bacterium]